jgi:hypothetical protein
VQNAKNSQDEPTPSNDAKFASAHPDKKTEIPILKEHVSVSLYSIFRGTAVLENSMFYR